MGRQALAQPTQRFRESPLPRSRVHHWPISELARPIKQKNARAAQIEQDSKNVDSSGRRLPAALSLGRDASGLHNAPEFICEHGSHGNLPFN